jgi:hypothetical protein
MRNRARTLQSVNMEQRAIDSPDAARIGTDGWIRCIAGGKLGGQPETQLVIVSGGHHDVRRGYEHAYGLRVGNERRIS